MSKEQDMEARVIVSYRGFMGIISQLVENHMENEMGANMLL